MTARVAGTLAKFATQITRFEKKVQDGAGRMWGKDETS